MKNRAILFAALLGWLVVVLAVGGSAVKAGISPALVGGCELAALVLALVVAAVVRGRARV